MKQLLQIIFILLLSASSLKAQHIPVHPSSGVYSFLTELANEGIIELNTAVEPYGRKQVFEILSSVDPSLLNERQLSELDFYLRDYNKELYPHKDFPRRYDLLYYRDSSFSITVNPILGGNLWLAPSGNDEQQDQQAWHWWNGAEARGTYGKWGFYGSLRDNHESRYLTQPDFLNRNAGGANFKRMSDGQVDYWEYRGGITYDFGIGNIGLYKDHFVWGSNYHGANIFSGHQPSFAYLALNMKPVDWFEFRYVHGWLVSEVVDSTRSFYVTNAYGTDYRERYHGKYLAANFFTFRPFRKFHISFGNSIIYDYDQPHPAYFIPVMFYKAVDHGLSSRINNMNSQLFFDISSRNLKYTHLYATLFIDEMAVHRIMDPDEHNFYSFKGGIRITNLIPNVYAGAEYTISNALAFKHFVPTLTFESNRFNMGHYLTDNAKELYLTAGYRPFRTMDVSFSYTRAEKGPDHTSLGTDRVTIEPFTPVVWEMDKYSLKASWQVVNDVYLRMGYTYSNIRGEEAYLERYTPAFRRGERGVAEIGVNVGW